MVNAAARALRAAGFHGIELDLQNLLERACRSTGLDRFGDAAFLQALGPLLQSLNSEAQLNPYGRIYARRSTVQSLKNRLWANLWLERHPEICQHPLEAPVIIVGPHRSGTTRLHRMLAADSRLAYLTTWEGLNPAPRPGRPQGGRRARRNEARAALALAHYFYPGSFAGHAMAADSPEEEMLLLNHSFSSFFALGAYHVPGYYRWFLDCDKTPAYRDMAALLKLISWAKGDRRRWLLKNPQHMMDLDVLLAVFPDARVVFTHRDPRKTVASVMSLMWHYAVQHTDAPCRQWIRDVWMDFSERSARRCMRVRESLPAGQQLDVYYGDMDRDWRSVLLQIYAFIGLEWCGQTEAAIGASLEQTRKQQVRYGEHRYALEDFGTTAAEIDELMSFYRRRYAIPAES